MSKIIGVTVGTPTSPRKMAQELNPIRTINGVAPDENGNVEVSGGGSSGGLTEGEIQNIVDRVIAELPTYDNTVTIE